ncbi:hypothetical protein Glove_431g27 [Diversispora epigaea]|uniref:Nudix hydrolase domain-containing protein n=1 Tax=Diversispora epigaea TaxID=1348612 RepID=A0A397GX05_9GLOM|nr:hypothetical protein Glove_431g27 [Diversispora epigaea]
MKSIIKHSLIPHSSSFLHSFHSSTFHSSNFINNQNNNNQLDHNQKNNITDFDAETLELIRARLKQTFKENSKYHLKYNLKYKEIANDAAVLMPLCIANGKPSVLFTIRSQNLKTHKGEVSFPGGKKDPTDQSPEITALRETFEEIRISPKDIDILGQDTILPNKDYTLKVHPFVGFIKFPIRIELIRARLKQTFKENSKYHLKYNLKYKEIANDAAVLMPLCIANGKPSVLFTIRSQNLKTHKGEVSFPGGKKDPTDQSPEITALRETFEEIRISPKDIDILGQDTILPNKDYTLKVHPFVGFIKFPIRIGKDKDDQEINYNKHEVSGVFTVTLNELLNPKIRTYRQFRNTKIEYPVYQAPSWAKLEIWGLTAFILNNILKKLTDPPLKKK